MTCPDSPWFVMLTAPQQDLTTVWRLHELGLEMFVPVIRERRSPSKINQYARIDKNGRKITRVIARPMFPGYGFLRDVGGMSAAVSSFWLRHGLGDDIDPGFIEETRRVKFMKDKDNKRIRLPHQAVLAVFQKQNQLHLEWLQTVGARRGALWKRGDLVRVDAEGGAYAGLVATVDKIDSKKGRVQVLLGMIRHTLPADMVVAA